MFQNPSEVNLRERLYITGDTDHDKYNGQRFEILREVSAKEADIHEVGPMFEVMTESGDAITVFFDEAFDLEA